MRSLCRLACPFALLQTKRPWPPCGQMCIYFRRRKLISRALRDKRTQRAEEKQAKQAQQAQFMTSAADEGKPAAQPLPAGAKRWAELRRFTGVRNPAAPPACLATWQLGRCPRPCACCPALLLVCAARH